MLEVVVYLLPPKGLECSCAVLKLCLQNVVENPVYADGHLFSNKNTIFVKIS